MPVVDPRANSSLPDNNKKAITDLSRNLPEMIRSHCDSKVKSELQVVLDGLDNLKDLFNGLEKTNIELLKWHFIKKE